MSRDLQNFFGRRKPSATTVQICISCMLSLCAIATSFLLTSWQIKQSEREMFEQYTLFQTERKTQSFDIVGKKYMRLRESWNRVENQILNLGSELENCFSTDPEGKCDFSSLPNSAIRYVSAREELSQRQHEFYTTWQLERSYWNSESLDKEVKSMLKPSPNGYLVLARKLAEGHDVSVIAKDLHKKMYPDQRCKPIKGGGTVCHTSGGTIFNPEAWREDQFIKALFEEIGYPRPSSSSAR